MIRFKQVTALVLTMLLLGTAQAIAADPLADSVNDPARSDADRQRDQRSKPAQMMAFMAVSRGVSVLTEKVYPAEAAASKTTR